MTSKISGRPEGNFQIVLFQNDRHVATVKTDIEGLYKFSYIPVGTYTVAVLPYYSSSFVFRTEATIHRGQNVLDMAVPPVF